MRLRETAGAASLLDLQAQQGLVAQARASLAQMTRQRALDAHALAQLMGQPLADGGQAPAGRHRPPCPYVLTR